MCNRNGGEALIDYYRQLRVGRIYIGFQSPLSVRAFTFDSFSSAPCSNILRYLLVLSEHCVAIPLSLNTIERRISPFCMRRGKKIRLLQYDEAATTARLINDAIQVMEIDNSQGKEHGRRQKNNTSS